MTLAEASIKRPVTVAMIFLAVVILGFIALFRIPLEFMPMVTIPRLTIEVPYKAASPLEVQRLIAKPLEESFSTLMGLKEIKSTSSMTGATFNLTFESGRSTNFMVLEARERIDAVRDELPDDINHILIWKMDTSMFPVEIVSFTVDKSMQDPSNLIETRIKRKLERVSGVASIYMRGLEAREIQIELNQPSMSSLGIGLFQVFNAIRSGNLTMTTGSVEHLSRNFSVRVVGELDSVAGVRDLYITPDVQLKDIASVEAGYEKAKAIYRINQRQSFAGFIQKESDANTVETCLRINAALDEIRKDPSLRGVGMIPFLDQSKEILSAVKNVRRNGAVGGILAIIVLFIFLKNIRATMIVAIAIPMSIIMSISAMYFLDMSFNMISMSGLMLGIGMLVDNAIVILESIYSARQKGMTRLQAAREGSKGVSVAITVATSTTVIVFLPLMFAMPSEATVIMREFGVVLSLSIVASLIVALTLVPLLCSRFLRATKAGETPKWFLYFQDKYGVLIEKLLKSRAKALAGVGVLVMLTVIPFGLIGKEGVPAAMMGVVEVGLEFKKSVALEVMNERMKKVEEIIAEHREEWGIENSSAWLTQDFIMIHFMLPEGTDVTMSGKALKRKIIEVLPPWPGMNTNLQQQGMGKGDVGASGARVIIQGPDPDVLYDVAEEVREIVSKLPGIVHVNPVGEDASLELDIAFDRTRAQMYGLDVTQAAYEVGYGIRGTKAGWINKDGRQIDLFMQLRNEDREALGDIEHLPLTSNSGTLLPLRSVAGFSTITVPRAIERKNRRNILNIPIEYDDEIIRDVFVLKKVLDTALEDFHFPQGFTWTMGGQLDEIKDALTTLGLAIFLAIILVFIVMTAQFESFSMPFIIMFALPFSIIGIFWSLFVSGNSLNVLSGAGILLLTGIVVNNAIVLVDHIKNLRNAGLSNMESLIQGSRDRIRPIMMTAITTLMGLLPMAVGASDSGHIMYSPLAIAVLGGLLSSTLLIPIMIPLIFSLMDDFNTKSGNWFRSAWTK